MAEAVEKLHGFPVHPGASRFPLLGKRETAKLAEDIKVNGLKMPGTTWKGQLVDGRNRLNAWVEAGLKVKDFPTEEYVPSDDVDVNDEKAIQRELYHTIWSLNMVRRHLSDRQKVAMVAKFHDDLGDLEEISDEELASEAKASLPTTRKVRSERKKNKKKIDDLAEGKKGKQGRPAGGAPAKVVSINREELSPSEAAATVIKKWAEAPRGYLKNFVFQLNKQYEEHEAEQALLEEAPNGAGAQAEA